MISQFATFTSFQVNVDANHQNIIGDAANECSISVDPTNGNKKTIAWRQFNNVISNFRQAAGVTRPMAAPLGPSPACSRTAFSAAIR